jgi:WD40 repeat protein
MRTLSIGRFNFNGIAYTADGRFLATLNSRRRVRFWDAATFEERLSFWLPPSTHLPAAWGSPFALHGNLLLLRDRVLDLAPALGVLREPAGRPGGSPGAPYTVLPLETAPGSYILSLATDGRRFVGTVRHWPQAAGTRVRIWDSQGRCQKEIPGRPPLLYWRGLAVAPDGRTAAVPASATVVLLDLAAGEEVAQLKHTDHANRTLFSPDGRLLAAGSREGEVRLWDTASCKPVVALDWKIGAVRGLAFAPDGLTVAAAGHGGRLMLWDLD